MKRIILAMAVTALILLGLAGTSDGKNDKYWPVFEFVGTDSVLGQWYQEYVDALGARASFRDFCKRLAGSDALAQQLDDNGLNYDELEKSINNLYQHNWTDEGLFDRSFSELRADMLSLDIALGAIEARLSEPAKNELRREVLRGANVVPEVVKLPTTPSEVMVVMLGP